MYSLSILCKDDEVWGFSEVHFLVAYLPRDTGHGFLFQCVFLSK
jgi:hypothetical protein